MPIKLTYKRKLLHFVLALLLLISIYSTFFYIPSMFIVLIDGFEVLLGFTIMTIAICTKNISQNKAFSILAISLGFVAFIKALSMFFCYSDGSYMLPYAYIYLHMFSDVLRLISVILFLSLYSKPINFKLIFLFYLFITTSFILALLVFDVIPNIHTILFREISIREVINFSIFISALYLNYLLSKSKYNFDGNILKMLIYILFCMQLTAFLYLFYKWHYFLRPVSHMSSLINFYFLYKLIIQATLIKPYNTLFMDLDRKSEELKKSKNLYENLVEALPASVLISHDDKIIFANSTSLDLFRCSNKDSLHNRSISSVIPKENIKNYMENTVNNKNSFITRFKTLDNYMFDAEVSEIDISFNNNLCTLTLIKDVSEKRKINELSLRLQKKIEKDNLRTEFFSNLSHELRTPINVIYSASQLQSVYIKNKDLVSIEKYNKIIRQNCLRLIRMCNNLIDITKIDTGYFKPNRNYINIVSIIENIVSSVLFYIEDKNMSIVFDTNTEDCLILCDGDIIERIILNLISNSLKYGKEYGSILLNIIDSSDYVSIIFKDDGPGIPENSINSIFDKFIQVDKSLNIKKEGSGLGLSLVKSLVEILGGSIKLESGEGLGCEFTIVFPKNCSYIRDETLVSDDNCTSYHNLVEKVSVEFSDIYL